MLFRTILAAASLALAGLPAKAQEPHLPIIAPITGFLALEGTSQANGAILAARQQNVDYALLDSAASPQTAVQAFDRAMREEGVIAVSAPIYGNSMLALLPRAAEREVPLLTVSGTASLTEQDNPWIFRFFPGDAVVKRAQARYIVEELGHSRVALIAQSTAYGQSGQEHLNRYFEEMGAEVVYENSVAMSTRDMTPMLVNIRESGADVVALHLHSPSTALFVRQAHAFGLEAKIVAGSAMHQPTTAALLEPAELEGVCAETSASPISDEREPMQEFVAAYRRMFDKEPDAFAAGQYDAVMMALTLRGLGHETPQTLREALASSAYEGVAMRYRSDGTGNMAHSAVIICYDGEDRVPGIVKRYPGTPS